MEGIEELCPAPIKVDGGVEIAITVKALATAIQATSDRLSELLHRLAGDANTASEAANG